MTERQKSTPRTISFVTTEEQLAALNRLAKEQERSISWLIRKALDEYLNKSK
ncbi:ribbon-helix-helix protein, CopG family [Candidatus Avelusimicrobium alvi]|uniref:ribbon-helix-helix protein, CopG family n=1 Tax=Candidatus Avelusimicrobium alvi TaxID=3416221 RepID=UPI003D0B8E26